MQIESTGLSAKSFIQPSTLASPSNSKADELQLPEDTIELNRNQESSSACRKVFGSIGAAVGAVLGRAATAIGTGVTAAIVLGALGPVAAGIGAVAGLALGYKAEVKTKIGRIAGGLIGGAAGAAAGFVTSKLTGFTPGETLTKETQGFTLKGLFQKLSDPKYTSHTKLTREEAEKFMDGLQPGDLIITNDDGDFQFEITQKLLGKTGNWTHIGLISEKNSVLEVLIEADGTAETDPMKRFTDNHHVMVLRPKYSSPDEVKKVIDEARSYFGKVTYDHSFNMKTDDKQYCQEYIYKVMRKASPDVELKSSSLLGLEYVTADNFVNSPDMTKVRSTGSNFWINYLSKFD